MICEGARDGTADAIRRATAGDAEGLTYLYRRYAPGVYGYVRQIVSNEHDAEDVTQQVFLKLVTRLGMYESKRAPFAAWMLRVARNTAIDHLRQRRLTLLDGDYESELEDARGDSEAGQSLRDALEALTQTQRDVLLLREVAGLTPTEVAERLGKTQGAVNTCYHRACLAARSTLESMGSAPFTLRTRTGA
jgi:RNA polymerase sigma-70 factor (ECF subfamily)